MKIRVSVVRFRPWPPDSKRPRYGVFSYLQPAAVNDVRWVQIDQNPGGAILYLEHSDACLVQMTMPKINLQQTIGAVDIRISIISLLLCLLAGMPLSAMAQTDLDIDVIRQAAEDVFDQVEIGAGYAAIVDFAVSRDISSATFYPDEVY
ncbi:MAG: hypothetical protein WBM57_11405, partial [Woeseiaceae bacterium]